MLVYNAPGGRHSISVRVTGVNIQHRYGVHGENLQVSSNDLLDISDFFRTAYEMAVSGEAANAEREAAEVKAEAEARAEAAAEDEETPAPVKKTRRKKVS
jgi:hypothetical protein